MSGPIAYSTPAGTPFVSPATPLPVTPVSGQYATVAASQTAQVLGAHGKTGDYLAGLLVTPATVGAGAVTVLDGSTSIKVFASGTLADLKTFYIPIGAISVNGPWKITTAANVSLIAFGNFTP